MKIMFTKATKCDINRSFYLANLVALNFKLLMKCGFYSTLYINLFLRKLELIQFY